MSIATDATETTAPDILESFERGVLTLTLNRPDRHNAFDDGLIAALQAGLARAESDADVRVVLLTGAGASFCAGADLRWMKSKAHLGPAENAADALAMAGLFARLDALPKPVVARVHGPAMGGGVGLAACADIVVAGPKAEFALSEVRLGMAPAVISPFVVRKIGPSRARDWFLTGDKVNAQAAYVGGLVQRLADTDESLDALVASTVQSLLRGAPGALAACKDLAKHAHLWERPEERTSQLIATLRASDEGQEGMRAFLERRSPAWIK